MQDKSAKNNVPDASRQLFKNAAFSEGSESPAGERVTHVESIPMTEALAVFNKYYVSHKAAFDALKDK